jgi:hypothetical protein
MYNRFSRTKFPANIGWHLLHFRSVHLHTGTERGDHAQRAQSFQLGTVDASSSDTATNVYYTLKLA